MRKFRFLIVIVVAALGFCIGTQLGFGNRIYIDFVSGSEIVMAKIRESEDYFVLGSVVYLFGSIAARFVKAGYIYAFASALVIVLIDVSRRTASGQWSAEYSLLTNAATVLIPYFVGVFAVFGFWTFCERILLCARLLRSESGG